MMLLGMNSKRQRRPNVRLGEIGDFSAALCCVSSHRPKQNLEEIRCIDELENPNHSDFNPKSGYPMENSELVVLDPGFVQNQNDLSDKMHNLENWNPNSKSVCEPPASNGTNAIKPNLDFGVITKKCRAMKRRGRSTMGYRRVSGRAWSSRVYPETSEKSNKEVCQDYSVNELEGTSDRKLSYTEKEDYYENYFVEPDSDVQVGGGGDSDVQVGGGGDSDELMIDSHKELPQTMNYDSDDEPCTGPESSVGIDKMGSSYKMGNGVSEWLDQLGFSKYIDMFEIHEVDEQVLPELTFDDLKEMGVNAVGSRRKIYNAIQLLKEENASI